MEEIWKGAPGFPDYEVSSFGRVKRIVPDARNHKPGILKPWTNNKGYSIVALVGPDGPRRKLVSRLVCEAFHGPAPEGMGDAAHNDGDHTCNHADNLRWASRAENMADCVVHGTKATGQRHGRSTKPDKTPRGEKHGHSKLTEADVVAIRASNDVGRSLAKQYGISPSVICVIRSRKIWKHVA